MLPTMAGISCTAHARDVFAAMETGKPYPVGRDFRGQQSAFVPARSKRTYAALKSLDLTSCMNTS